MGEPLRKGAACYLALELLSLGLVRGSISPMEERLLEH